MKLYYYEYGNNIELGYIEPRKIDEFNDSVKVFVGILGFDSTRATTSKYRLDFDRDWLFITDELGLKEVTDDIIFTIREEIGIYLATIIKSLTKMDNAYMALQAKENSEEGK